MPTLTPYRGRSSARLTALINAANNKNIVEGVDFTYGTPVAISPDTMGRNTKVTLHPATGSHYKAPQDIFYTRLGIDALTRLPPDSVDAVLIWGIPFSVHQMLPNINFALGLDLLPEEVEDTVYNAEQPTYTLRLLNTSLAWHDSVFQFRATTVPLIPLASVVRDPNINALDYTRPPSP